MDKSKKKGKGAKTEIIDVAAKDAEQQKSLQVRSEFDIQENSAERLIAQAISKNVPVETMEKLLSMRRELKQEWAREEYNRAMAAFQAECPVIQKRKQARDETKNKDLYKYAPLDDIIAQTQVLIAKHGFSYTFRQENDGNKVKVACIVSHASGHSEESVMETGLATKTNIMSGPQQIASTVTFNKRYAFCNAFGIMTGDEDMDAAKNIVEPPQDAPKTEQKPEPPKPVFINKPQADEINSLIKALRIPGKDALREMSNVVERDVTEFKGLSAKEAEMIIAEFKERLVKIQTAEGVNIVDPSVNAPKAEPIAQNASFNTRAMNCQTQEEAESIIGEATLSKDVSEVKMTALKGILNAKGFNV